MPIYEYSCGKCRARVEVMQKMTDKPLKRCQSCGGKLEKEWSTGSFQLKGSGWYVTDYAAKKSGTPDKELTKSESSETATKTEGAAETKTPTTTSAETKAEPSAAATTEETKRRKPSQPAATSKPSKSD